MQIYLTCFVIILRTLSACTVLDESGELVSDPECMSSAILPTPTPTIDSKDPDSSSDGLVTGVATAVGALVMVIIVVVVVVATVVYMTRKRKLLQQRVFEEPDFLGRYLLHLLTFTYIEYNTIAIFDLCS